MGLDLFSFEGTILRTLTPNGGTDSGAVLFQIPEIGCTEPGLVIYQPYQDFIEEKWQTHQKSNDQHERENAPRFIRGNHDAMQNLVLKGVKNEKKIMESQKTD